MFFNHLSSHVVVAMDQYSTLADERDIVCCFLVFQDTGELPRKMIQPVRDRRVRGQLAQLELHHAERRRLLSLCRRTHCPRLPFKYRTT